MRLFSKAQAALSGGTRVSSSSGNRVYVRLNGNEYTRMWWIKSWLFVFRSQGGTDPEAFMEAYMKAMEAVGTPLILHSFAQAEPHRHCEM